MYDKDKIYDAISIYNKKNNYGLTIKDILDLICIARSTLYEWINIYGNDLDNIEYVMSERIKNKLQKYIKICPDCKLFIINHVSKYPNFNVKKLKRKIFKTFDVHISKGYVYKILKDNNITYKKVCKNSYPHNKQKFKKESNILKNKIDKINNDYTSIDETGIYLGMRPNRAWERKGERCVSFRRKNLIDVINIHMF